MHSSRAGIIPPYMLYQLTVQPYWRNSPQLPAVLISKTDLYDGHTYNSHVITPEQARELAAQLIAAADAAERANG